MHVCTCVRVCVRVCGACVHACPYVVCAFICGACVCVYPYIVCVCVSICIVCVVQKPNTVIVVDEIGRMELHSEKFQQAILKLLDDPTVTLFGAITAPIYGNRVPFCDRIEAHDRVQVLRLKKSNRDTVTKAYSEVVKKNLVECGLLPTSSSRTRSQTIRATVDQSTKLTNASQARKRRRTDAMEDETGMKLGVNTKPKSGSAPRKRNKRRLRPK